MANVIWYQNLRHTTYFALDFFGAAPDAPGVPFHDHWLGLVAMASGDVAYVDRPLYDYVQHPGAVFGPVAGGATLSGYRSGPTAVCAGIGQG